MNTIERIIADAKTTSLAHHDGLYLNTNLELVISRTQPHNTLCLAVNDYPDHDGRDEDVIDLVGDWSDVVESITQYAEVNGIDLD